MPGYKVPSGVATDRGWQCAHCHLLLREAMQTEDGDRLCQSCCEEIKQMEGQTCGECGVKIGRDAQVFPDRAVRKLILALEFNCEHQEYGCPWQGKLADWEAHCSKCVYQPATCPNEGCGLRLPLSQLDQHIDSCPHRRVACQHCQEEVAAGQLQEHNEVCPRFPVQCQFCEKQVPRSQLHEEHHQRECVVQSCSVCGKLVDRETSNIIEVTEVSQQAGATASPSTLDASLQLVKKWTTTKTPHLADPKTVHRHMQELGHQLRVTKRDVESIEQKVSRSDARPEPSLRTELSEMRTNHQAFIGRLVTIEGDIEAMRQNLGSERREVKLKTLENLQQKLSESFDTVATQGKAISDREQEIADLRRKVDSLRSSSRENTQAIAQLQSAPRLSTGESYGRKTSYHEASATTAERSTSLEKKVEELERQTSLLKVHVSELELQLQASLASTHTGSFLWRIPDVARRRRDAIEERITSIYSPPFYTGRNGYKMCVRAYLNGDGSGYKTHLSLFFVLMKGEYDPLLKWPFDNKVSLILVDQDHRKHIVQTFKPSPESPSFKQPTSDMNVASGCPQFARLSVLDTTYSDASYVKKDVMFIKCIVDTSKIFHP